MESIREDIALADRDYYSAGRRPEIVFIGEIRYIVIEGIGKPGGEEYTRKIDLLYALVDSINREKKEYGFLLGNLKLECQYWVDPNDSSGEYPPNRWNWKLMIRIPQFVSRDDIEDAKYEILSGKDVTGIRNAKLQALSAGMCVQALHKGPYERVGETYDRIAGFMLKKGLKHNGPYHEVYLSDPDWIEPEKLKTIVRQPVR